MIEDEFIHPLLSNCLYDYTTEGTVDIKVPDGGQPFPLDVPLELEEHILKLFLEPEIDVVIPRAFELDEMEWYVSL
jgi:hypothetical protein